MCGENDVRCLVFHHRIPASIMNKKKRINDCVNSRCSIKRIVEEIQYCDVVCANCHAKIHYKAPPQN